MARSGGKERLRMQVIRGIALLLIIVGMLTVGILGPEAFSVETIVAAVIALESASQSVSPAPLIAAGLLVGGFLLAVYTEFGPFGGIDSNQGRKTATCRICKHRINESQTKCPYCNTENPVGEQ